MSLDVRESPATPTDCRVATRLPAATPPPLAMAAADIILAAKEEAAMPAPVKPTALSTTGTDPTATTPPITTAAALAADGSTARTLLEAAPWALARLTADIILAREEAVMACMEHRVTGTRQSRTCTKGGALMGVQTPKLGFPHHPENLQGLQWG